MAKVQSPASNSGRKPGEPEPPALLEASQPSTALEHWAPLLIFVMAVVAYLPTLGNSLVSWDDDIYLYNNPQLTKPKGLQDIWTNYKTTQYKAEGQQDTPHQYYPLTLTLVYAQHRLFHRLAGTDPGQFDTMMEAPRFHTVSMAWHGVNGILLALVLRRLGAGVWVAWVVGALFAVTPMNVATVAWAAEQKNIFALFFYMLALLCYVRYRRGGGRMGLSYFGVLAFFQCALWSKTVAVTFPIVVFLTDQLLDTRRTLGRFVTHGCFILVVAIVAFVPALLAGSWGAAPGLVLAGLGALLCGVVVGVDRQLGRRLTGSHLVEFLPVLAMLVLALGATRLMPERWSVADTIYRYAPLWALVAALFLIDRAAGGRLKLDGVLRIAPLLVMAAVATSTTIYTEDRARDVPLTDYQRPFVAAGSIWYLALKLIVPIVQSPIYQHWNPDVQNYRQWHPANDLFWWLPILGLLAAGWVLFRQRRKVAPHFLWGLGFYVVTQLPMMGWKNINFFQFAFVSDHYVYHGCMGVFLMAAIALDAFRKRGEDVRARTRWVTTGVCVLLAAYGAKTAVYCRVWESAERFWTTTLAHNPGCWAGWYNLANQYNREWTRLQSAGDAKGSAEYLDKAIDHYKHAIDTKNDLTPAYKYLLAMLAQRNRTAELEDYCNRAERYSPYLAFYHRAGLRASEKHYEEACALYEKALNPRYVTTREERLNVYERAGEAYRQVRRWDDAVRHFTKYLELAPAGKHRVWVGLGVAYYALGRCADAEQALRRALQLQPDDAEAAWYLERIRKGECGQSLPP